MPRLTYTAREFPQSSAPALSGTHTLDFDWSELVWAAISVGRAGFRELFQFGVYSTFEILYRAALLYANLREASDGFLNRSDAYNALDPSEKSAISYFLGLTASKLFAGRCLQVPWLLHLDVYRTTLQPVLNPGRSRPDLIGQNCNGDWVVIESKGRTNEFEHAALDKAKAQTRLVRSISGCVPRLRVGIQAYFESSRLTLGIADPSGDNSTDTIDLPITSEMITNEYYQPFREWLAQADRTNLVRVGERMYFVRVEPEFDIAVGLDAERFKAARIDIRLDEERIAGDWQLAPTILEGAGRHDQFAGADGVLVQLGPSWSSGNMRQQPENRGR